MRFSWKELISAILGQETNVGQQNSLGHGSRAMGKPIDDFEGTLVIAGHSLVHEVVVPAFSWKYREHAIQ